MAGEHLAEAVVGGEESAPGERGKVERRLVQPYVHLHRRVDGQRHLDGFNEYLLQGQLLHEIPGRQQYRMGQPPVGAALRSRGARPLALFVAGVERKRLQNCRHLKDEFILNVGAERRTPEPHRPQLAGTVPRRLELEVDAEQAALAERLEGLVGVSAHRRRNPHSLGSPRVRAEQNHRKVERPSAEHLVVHLKGADGHAEVGPPGERLPAAPERRRVRDVGPPRGREGVHGDPHVLVPLAGALVTVVREGDADFLDENRVGNVQRDRRRDLCRRRVVGRIVLVVRKAVVSRGGAAQRSFEGAVPVALHRRREGSLGKGAERVINSRGRRRITMGRFERRSWRDGIVPRDPTADVFRRELHLGDGVHKDMGRGVAQNLDGDLDVAVTGQMQELLVRFSDVNPAGPGRHDFLRQFQISIVA